MTKKDGPPADRARKALIQKLESLQRAGVTHVPKARKVAEAAVAEEPRTVQAPAPSGQTSVAKPQAAGAAKTAVPAANDPEGRVAALAQVAREVAACKRCAELARKRTQTVFGVGNPYARLVFIGEAPGADEDRIGEPFVGAAGQLLTDMIEKAMRLRRQDVYIMNILRCRPPGNRNPLPAEAANCRPFLDRQLAIIRPEFVCCLGAIAAQNLFGTTTPIGRMRGRVMDFQGMKVVCTYHPAYLLRTPSSKRPTWEDLKLLMAAMGLPVAGTTGGQ